MRGHDERVTGVSWHPEAYSSAKPLLASGAADKYVRVPMIRVQHPAPDVLYSCPVKYGWTSRSLADSDLAMSRRVLFRERDVFGVRSMFRSLRAESCIILIGCSCRLIVTCVDRLARFPDPIPIPRRVRPERRGFGTARAESACGRSGGTPVAWRRLDSIREGAIWVPRALTTHGDCGTWRRAKNFCCR